eukprot:Skav217267  [mRNA]  locus=scaffold47:1421391:1425681:+ [translate_table: standard]
MILGDFNQEPDDLVQQRIWRRNGWRSAQEVAAELFNHTIVPTCKGSTESDQAWLSPEAIQLLRSISITDDFADHSTIRLQFQIPQAAVTIHQWPRPASIPWSDLECQDWEPPCPVQLGDFDDSTKFMHAWASAFEDSVFQLAHQQQKQPPDRCRGRAQRRDPVSRTLTSPVSKPSREGEVSQTSSLTGAAVRHWFKQLRRLQSLKHAVLASKQTPEAITYRRDLWRSIRMSRGFHPTFPTWWSHQVHEIAGVLIHLPFQVPEEPAFVQAMYDSFLLHFRKFEAWHLRERSRSLKAKYEGSLEAIYMDLKAESKPGITTFWKDNHYTILAVDAEDGTLQLDQHVQTDHDSLSLILDTFRRMLGKCPDLLMLWKIRMRDFDGKYLPGPFSQLLQCLQTIGWSVEEPPYLWDHEGFCWNLAQVDNKTLRNQLEDAWLQYVASQVKHRTMHDLDGLDGYLTKLDLSTMSALDRARMSALQSGAFLSNYEHARYDDSKQAVCSLCGCPDDRVHWLLCPRFQHLRDAIPDWRTDHAELPSCTLHHLLVPRQRLLVQWRRLLEDRMQANFCFLVDPPISGFHHLFLDGSCFGHEHPVLNLAAWAVVSATLGTLVASAPLVGITQTIDRAELTSLLVALEWDSKHALDMVLWSDSLSTVAVAEYIQVHAVLPPGVANADLWTRFMMLLEDRKHVATMIRWVPAHLDASLAEDEFEAWAIRWNEEADKAAKHANGDRPDTIWSHRHQTSQLLDDWTTRIRQLRRFYFSVAEEKLADTSERAAAVQDPESDDEWLWIPWEDTLPVDWPLRCQDVQHIPGEFLRRLVTWICCAERLEGTVRTMSDLELTFTLVQDASFLFPFAKSGSKTWELRRIDGLFQRPTLTMLLRPVQSAMAAIGDLFDHVIRVPARPNRSLGVNMKFSCTRLKVPDELWRVTHSRILAFTASRPVRSTADLARPMP